MTLVPAVQGWIRVCATLLRRCGLRTSAKSLVQPTVLEPIRSTFTDKKCACLLHAQGLHFNKPLATDTNCQCLQKHALITCETPIIAAMSAEPDGSVANTPLWEQ